METNSFGETTMMVEGRNLLRIENYRSIIEYTDTSLKILGKNCRVHISGERLCIVSYNADVMLVKGIFKEIKFL